MCWKDEWIAAGKNLSSAIKHIETAKTKLQRRAMVNNATMEKATHKGRTDLFREADRRFHKNRQGIRVCDALLLTLVADRKALLRLVKIHGFSRKRSP